MDPLPCKHTHWTMSFHTRLNNLRLLLRDIRHCQQQRNNNTSNTEETSLLHQLYASLASSDGNEMLDYDSRMFIEILSSEGAIDTIIEAARRSTISNTGTGSSIGSLITAGAHAGTRGQRPILAHRVCAVLTLFAQEAAQRIAETGGFHAILNIMQAYRGSEQVQEACIVSLVELARIYGSSSNASVTSTVIINNVLDSLECHKYSPTIFYVACKALKISCLLGIRVEDENLAKRAQRNILDGIMLFPSNLRCQAVGCDALSTWVGEELAASMIQQMALTLVTACSILRQAMGCDD